jgi:hypothetical protein
MYLLSRLRIVLAIQWIAKNALRCLLLLLSSLLFPFEEPLDESLAAL